MRLARPEALAKDIERGLGEVSFIARSQARGLRMRDSYCGLVSVAIVESLRQEGQSVELVLSSPNLSVDPDMTHIMPVVSLGNERTIIDGTYSQFLSYAGLIPGYVKFGGQNKFPAEKIAVFPVGGHQPVVDLLADTARSFVDSREEIAELSWKKSWPFDALSRDEIAAILTRIWDPENFTSFEPDEKALEVGRKMARHILPQHAELIV